MSLTKTEAFELTQRAIALFTGVGQIRRDARLALLLAEEDDPMPGIEDTTLGVKNTAAMSVRNLAFIVVVSKALREQSTAEVLYSITDSIVRGSVDRPLALPTEQPSCHEFAVPLALKTLMRFQRLLLERCEFQLSIACLGDPAPLDELAKMIGSWDKESAVCVLQIIVEAIDAVNFTDADFDAFAGAAKREGAAIASEIANDADTNPIQEARDKMIWENIVSMSRKELILRANDEKKFPGLKSIETLSAFKRAALRYSHPRKLPTRNFRKEEPWAPTDTK